MSQVGKTGSRETTKQNSYTEESYEAWRDSAWEEVEIPDMEVPVVKELAPFDIPQLREIMSYDEMELDRLWDEAANTGQVPNLEKLVAVIRSREVSLMLFYQQLAQCKAIYDKNAKTILGNMDSVVFHGGREASTIKEISTFFSFAITTLQTLVIARAWAYGALSICWRATDRTTPAQMLMYGKEASNRKQEIDRQHHTIPNQRNQKPKDKHCGNLHNRIFCHG